MSEFIRFFKEIGIQDVTFVGGKNASLGEMYQKLIPQGVRVPNGFAITAQAYFYLLKHAHIEEEIKKVLQGLNHRNTNDLAEKGEKVRNLILNATLPDKLQNEIKDAYQKLCEEFEDNTDVAVRSSATAEDLPDASFAGQQETFLNIRGPAALLEACRKCFASLFTNRAIAYRAEKGFDHFKVGLSIGVQKMIRSDLASSGVMFSIDTETGFSNAVFINSSYGLGENIVQGVVNPDEFYVFKPTLKQGYQPIISKKLGSKEIKMIYNPRGGTKETRNIPVPASERNQFSISDDEILELAKWASLIEEHYQTPMDIEWAKDGKLNQLFILQARPETVHAHRDVSSLEVYHLKKTAPILVKGRAVGSRIGQGKARIIQSAKNISDFEEGEVLVTEMTDPDWVPIMKKAAAIVTERGGRTCHAAIVSRELGLPAIIGAEHALTKIQNGDEVTVSCAQGEEGIVYEGLLPFKIEKIHLEKTKDFPVKIMMNIAQPEQAFEYSFLPNDGVGLARMEFIISNAIKVHPLALLHYPNIQDEKALKEIEELTQNYKNKPQYFVDKLAEGVARIAAAFYPKDVILRFSDFKTNEYAGLVGGQEFEPKEENPMLGFRGASRYYHPHYQKGFALECEAVKIVREKMGLTNLKVMIPFCRTLEEGKKVLDEMAKNGLERGKNSLEVYVMCEIPSNVLLAEEFADLFDGFSIGSNDLTQLTLGLDRDSEIVSSLFDERNPAVKKIIEMVIQTANQKKIKIGICGQAPSDYPEYADFLIKAGIDSISLNPDSIVKTLLRLTQKKEKVLDFEMT